MAQPTPPKVNTQFASIVEAAEISKKRADVQFARSEFDEAIETYSGVIMRLANIRGSSQGETCVIRCLANQAQCYLKVNDNEKAISACKLAISVPSSVHEPHLLTKIYIRLSFALESQGKIGDALTTLDKAVGIGLVGTSVAELDKIRDRLIDRLNELSEKEGVIIPIPSKPLPISPIMVGGAITHILTTKGDPTEVLPPLTGTVKMKGNLDVRDERGYNLIWAVCQAALMRAVSAAQAAKEKSPTNTAPKLPSPPLDSSLPPTPGDDEDKEEEEEEEPNEADVVLPILKVLLENGARAEQRFPSQNNRTPLQLLAMAGAVECAHLAIRYGAGVFTYDDSGWTPLLVACSPNGPRSGNNADMVELLIRAGSRVDHQTETGLCPLSAAAQCNDGESVELLLEAGAKISNRCGMGFSPVIWGLIGGNGIPNAAVNALLKVASQNPDTKYEVDQDMRCYYFSRLLNSLKVAYNRSIEASNQALKIATESNGTIQSGVLVDENGKVDPKQHRIAIVSQMTRFVAITSGNSGSDFNIHDVSSNPLLKLFLSIEGSMPDIFKNQWRVKEGATFASPAELLEALLKASNHLQNCWINIILLAVNGPSPNMPPPLTKRIRSSPNSGKSENDDDFFHIRLYNDYKDIVQDSLSNFYSPVIPSNQAIAELSLLGPILEVDESNGYWGNVLRGFNKEIDIITINVAQDIISHDGSRVLLLVSPLSADTLNDVISLFMGNTIIYAGQKISETSDTEFPDSEAYIISSTLKLSSFNNVKKIALPNWLWESNELSIWNKAE